MRYNSSSSVRTRIQAPVPNASMVLNFPWRPLCLLC
ncbi:hypothetical protein MC885_000759 [Smutsia gigantea]|nr:hypothetical protein MC885_000759 [Smutsia gigantea]